MRFDLSDVLGLLVLIPLIGLIWVEAGYLIGLFLVMWGE